jgi:hypothetical protein
MTVPHVFHCRAPGQLDRSFTILLCTTLSPRHAELRPRGSRDRCLVLAIYLLMPPEHHEHPGIAVADAALPGNIEWHPRSSQVGRMPCLS